MAFLEDLKMALDQLEDGFEASNMDNFGPVLGQHDSLHALTVFYIPGVLLCRSCAYLGIADGSQFICMPVTCKSVVQRTQVTLLACESLTHMRRMK